MKILLRSKFYKIFGGKDKIGGGLISALENQKKMLAHLEIPFTENMDDNWDILQINIPWPESLKEAQYAKKNGKKIVMWSHVTVEDLEKSIRIFRIFPFLSYLVKKYLRYAYSHADLIFCPSEYTKNILISYGLPASKLFAQSNAVDIKKFHKNTEKRKKYRKKYKLSGLVIGNLSLVIPRKDPKTFIELSKKFTQNQFIWFGKIFNKFLVDGLPKTNLSHLHFVDFIEDPVSALNAIDIFLFPSLEENQGMVILEAASIGMPILVRDIPVYNGWLVHNVNCLKAKNQIEFEKNLNYLLTDSSLRTKLTQGALDLAKKESIQVQGIKIKSIYESLFSN
jgi:1,2-diacylglycerol-3-alpha-glucose alpha-1,2-glucosyltransferase